MSSGLLAVVVCCVAGAFAIILCRPSSGNRMMVFTILIALAMLAGVGFSVAHIANTIAENAAWSDR